MHFEEKVRNVIDGTQKLNRQQRRDMQRKGAKYEQKQTFTKEELQQANSAAYEYGKQIALKAAKKVVGLGATRLQRIEVEVAKLEYDTFVKPFEEGEEK